MPATSPIVLSKETLRLLSNLANINPNIFVKDADADSATGGHTLYTINDANCIYAQAKISETFPSSFGIWELHKLLSTLSLMEKPSLDFSKNPAYVVISDASNAKKSIKYYLTPENLLHIPKKKMQLPKHAIEASLSAADLKEIQKAAATLNLKDLCIQPGEVANTIRLTVLDKSDPTSNTFETSIPGTVLGRKTDFKLFLRIDNLKFLDGDYAIKLAEKAISSWEKSTGEITYAVALDKDSVYP